MNPIIRSAPAWLLALVAAGCGGGGGDSGVAAVTPAPAPAPTVQQVAITETNAKPVAASALDTTQNTSAANSAALVTGVEVQSTASPDAASLARAATALGLLAASAGGSSVPAGVDINRSANCPLGGSLSVSGRVGSSNVIAAGDALTITGQACRMNVGGVATTMNGTLALTVNSGSYAGSNPFHLNMTLVLTGFSTQSAAGGTSASGDLRIDENVTSSTAETLTVSGSMLTSTVTAASGASRTTTLRNYAQTIAIAGSTATTTLTATVETSGSALGGTSYTVTTPTAVVLNLATGLPSAGSVRVVGSNNSALLVTVSASGVSIQVDANGDGTYEKTLSATLAELRALL